MNIEDFREYCLTKRGATEDFPFDEDTLVFKVGGKMFALTSLQKWEEGNHSINLKCDPEYAIELREQFPDEVFPGYHMSKKHWNTVHVDRGRLGLRKIHHLINHSYDLVVSKLPKKVREALKN